MSNTLKCVFCGKELEWKNSHSIQPIHTIKGDRCCESCNASIVIPTRLSVWPLEDKIRTITEWLENQLVWPDEMVTIARGAEYEECRQKVKSLLEG